MNQVMDDEADTSSTRKSFVSVVYNFSTPSPFSPFPSSNPFTMILLTGSLKVATLAAVSVVGVGAVSVIGWKMMHRKSDPKSTHNLLNGGDADAKLEADEEEEEADTSLDSASGNSPSSPASISRRIKIEDPETVSRRLAIRNMALDAWTAHCNYAWGQDLLLPNKQEAFNFHFGPSSGHTLITALSTLWILDLKDEFTRASRWVENRFELSRIKQQWDVKDTVEDYIGSFLSCYALSGESMFLERAKEVALAIDGAYATKTGKDNKMVRSQKLTLPISRHSLSLYQSTKR